MLTSKLPLQFLLLASGWLLGPGRLSANPKIYERALESVVWVIPLDKSGTLGKAGFGSGVLVNQRERIVVTNYHVVREWDDILIFFPAFKGNDLATEPAHYRDNKQKLGVEGKVIARIKDRDLALIRLKVLPSGVREIPLAVQSPKPGEELHAIGNSGVTSLNTGTGALWRYSKGEVRQVFVKQFECGEPTIKINARIVEAQLPINPGDSGGPALNQRGELVAVTQGFQEESKQRQVSHLIDISEIRAFLKKQSLLPTPSEKR